MEENKNEEVEIDAIFWDLETTGFVAPECKILEIGAYIVRGDTVTKKHWVLQNNVEIPEKITEITGITKEIVEAEGRDPKDCLAEFLPLFKLAKKNVTHNGIKFDIPFLVEYAADLMGYTPGQKIAVYDLLHGTAYDTAVHFKAKKMGRKPADRESYIGFARRIMGTPVKGLHFNLTLCAQEMGIDLDGIVAHRALADVEVTHRIYTKLFPALTNGGEPHVCGTIQVHNGGPEGVTLCPKCMTAVDTKKI